MKKAPALPFFITVYDYHLFDGIRSAMQLINPKIKVEEVSLAGLDRFENVFDPHVAVVFEGRKPSDKVIADMLSNKKTKIHAV